MQAKKQTRLHLGLQPELRFTQLCWQRPFTAEEVDDLFRNLASARPRGVIIFEVRGKGNHRTEYVLGAEKQYFNKVKNICKAGRNIRFKDTVKRNPMDEVIDVKITKPSLALNTEITESVIRAGLAAINALIPGEEVVLQMILGPSHSPSEVSGNAYSPTNSWLDAILGSAKAATREQLSSMRDKAEQFSFDTVLRIGATGKYAKGAIANLLAAIRTMASVGVTMTGKAIKPELLNRTMIPSWRFPYRQRVSVKELTCLSLLPIGENELPASRSLHPVALLPPNWYKEPTNKTVDRTFAEADGKRLSISPKDALEHTILMGPTGSGKSTAMLNMILKDIEAGRSVLVIDPKYDLVNDVLSRIPESRREDVVVIDPSDPSPVGFNPLKSHKGQDTTLIADSVMAVFKQIFAENWGITTADTLSAALLTLAQTKDANLLWLAPLLTDDAFREKITKKLKDRIALKPFWRMYDAMKEGERRKQTDSTLNKLRQLTYRPGLRAILGQSNPKFDLMDLFYQRKIVLVPLNKGIIGAESAKLLGSLIVGLTWTLALSRAKLPAEKRHIVSLYIDELQDYLALPTDFSDALAQARGLGLAITCAHQYRGQLPNEIKEGIDANCRNKIYFGLQAIDAKEIAGHTEVLDKMDFISLPRYHIYTEFQNRGRSTGWILAETLPAPEPIRMPADLKAQSMQSYGIPIEETETEYLQVMERMSRPSNDEPPVTNSGIREK